MSALLIIFLVIGFFFLFKFTAAFTAIVAIIAGTTTITTLVCVWQGTSYSLKASGYKPNRGEQAYRQVDAGLKQIVGDLQEIRSQLEETELHLQNLEYLKYARQNRNGENES